MLDFVSEPSASRQGISPRQSIWIAVLAGLTAAIAAAILICRSPQSATPQFMLVLLAAAYQMVTAISGATGSYLYWARSRKWTEAWPTSELRELLNSTANGWVWIPAIVLLSRHDSIWAPAVAATGAVVLAVSLRRSGPVANQSEIQTETGVLLDEPQRQEVRQEIFVQTLTTPQSEWYGPVVALCIFGEVLVLLKGWLFPACLLLAIAGFAFAWARTTTTSFRPQRIRNLTATTIRQTRSALPALIVTVLALMIGVSHDIGAWGLGAGLNRGLGSSVVKPKTEASLGMGGHVSIVLLTAPQDKQIYAPQKRDPLLQGTHLIKPMVLQFDGEYWYFQWPEDGPGPHAFRTHGSPLAESIHSNSSDAINMQAHQHLGSPLPLDCCREIDVEIENRTGQNGALAMGMTLTDSASPGQHSLVLEGQPIMSEPNTSSAGQPGVSHSTLRFHIPPLKGSARPGLRQFDQIDFAIITAPAHAQTGAKLAIRTLEFIP